MRTWTAPKRGGGGGGLQVYRERVAISHHFPDTCLLSVNSNVLVYSKRIGYNCNICSAGRNFGSGQGFGLLDVTKCVYSQKQVEIFLNVEQLKQQSPSETCRILHYVVIKLCVHKTGPAL